ASYLDAQDITIEILDSYAENLGTLSTIDRIFAGPSIPRIVGLNASSPNIHIAHQLAKYLKRINPSIVVVCGGPHASLAAEHTLSTRTIDYVVHGEGEIPFCQLVKTILNDHRDSRVTDIPGVLSLAATKTL